MRRMKTAVALGILLPTLWVGAAAAQEKKAGKLDIAVENGLLSVNLDRASAADVFREITRTEKIVIRLDETLLNVPITEEFDKLPLEEGLKRLIRQLGTDNYLISYVAAPGGGRQVVGAEILVKGSSGVVQQFGAAENNGAREVSARAEDPSIPKGLRMKKARGLNPGERKHFERTGQLPRGAASIPQGLQEKMDRGEPLSGGNQWKVDRALGMEAPETPPGSEAKNQASGTGER